MSSLAENSNTPHSRRKHTTRITSPADDDDDSIASAPPPKRPRLEDSDDNDAPDSPETSRMSGRNPPASTSRSKLKKKPALKGKRSKTILSDPESDEFDAPDESDLSDPPVEEDDEEYMSEPKSTGKRPRGKKGKAAPTKGGKGKEKEKEIQIVMARDERKRPAEVPEPGDTPTTKRSRAKPGSATEIVVDGAGDGAAPASSPPKEPDPTPAPAPAKKKLPPIKKNKQSTGAGVAGPASGSAASTPSIAPKPLAPTRPAEDESKLPLPMVPARKPVGPLSIDLDLSNPTMYAQLFKTGGANTPLGSTRREKEEERRKELNKMRDEARAKRINDAAPAFDLQGQMDKINRFEEKLRASRSPAVYPNHLAGALKKLEQGSQPDLEPREDGEM